MLSDWLKTAGLDRCYLIEIDYLLEGVLYTLRRSTHPYRTAASDSPALTSYPDTVLKLPEFDRDMTEAFIGTSSVAVGELELYLDEQLQTLISEAVFGGQQIRMFVGDQSWALADFGQIMVGRVDLLDAKAYDSARVTFRDRSALFERPMQQTTISSGPNAGKPIPLCYGQCFNLSPVLIDTVTKTYQVHDGEIEALSDVRENGVTIPFTPNLAAGTFTLSNNATGRVTCDAEGAVVGAAYLSSADELIDHIITDVMGLPGPVGDTLPAYTLGLYITDEMSVAAALDGIAGSVGAAWFFNRVNQVVKVHFNGLQASSDDLTLDDIADESLLPIRRIAPAKSLTIGYERNWTPQADGLAGVVRETTPEIAVTYERGESVVSAENAGITVSYPDAVDITLSTLIALEADAITELARRLAIALTPHTVFELASFAAPFNMQLGQTVTIDYPQYFSGGGDALITRITDLPGKDSLRLEVWK